MRSSGYEYQSEFARKYYGEGKAEGQREMLRKLLMLKFGSLSAAQETRIQAAGSEAIERWLERFVTSDTVDAVLGE